MPSTPKHIDIDVAVVGAGILGLLVADIVARGDRERGVEPRNVWIFAGSEPPSSIPPRDSQRNHKWLQSGLLYSRDHGQKMLRMWGLGGELLRRVQIPVPTGTSIFRFRDDEPAEVLYEDARAGKMDHLVRELTTFDAERLLGAFYVPDRRHVLVPDVPFPESQLLSMLHRRARATNRVRFVVDDVAIKRGQTGETLLSVGPSVYAADTTVLCAGSGTPALLESIGIRSPVTACRSPLLRLYSSIDGRVPGDFRANLLVDRDEGGLAVVRTRTPTGMCLVVGNRRRTPLTSNQALMRRSVTPAEKDELVQQLPPQLRALGQGSPATAGHKTEASGRRERAAVEPWTERFEAWGMPRLIAGVPGKATLALEAAYELVALLPPPAGSPPSPGLAIEQVPDFRFHSEFPSIDEALATSRKMSTHNE